MKLGRKDAFNFALIFTVVIGLTYLSSFQYAEGSAVCPTGTSWDGQHCVNTKTKEPLIVKSIEIVKNHDDDESKKRKQKLLESYTPQMDPYVLYRITFEKAPDFEPPQYYAKPTISAIEQRIKNDDVSRKGIERTHYAYKDYLAYHAYLSRISVPFYSNFANPDFVDPPTPFTIYMTGKNRAKDVSLQNEIQNQQLQALIKSSNMYKIIHKFED